MKKRYENNIIFVPFEVGNFYSYKDRDELILEYPIKKIGKDNIKDFEFNNELPTVGFIYIYDKNIPNKKVPFAEISIKKIILPDEISDMMLKIENEKTLNIDKTYIECFDRLQAEDKLGADNREIREWVRKFLIQKINDKDINEVMKKKRFVWIVCDILEYYTSSTISQELHNYLQQFTPISIQTDKSFNNSLAFYMPKKDYLDFRVKLRKSKDYIVGEDVRSQAIINLKKGYIVNNYQLIFRNFNETAWRDLLISSPLNYVSNKGKSYNNLLHLILEKKINKEFEFYRSATEIRWKYYDKDLNKEKSGAMDGYLELIDDKNIKYRIYLEFKNFNKELTEKKDIQYQPLVIENKYFDNQAYNYNNNDEWRYIAITKGTNVNKLDKDFNSDKYIDLSWGEVFEIIVKEIYPMAIESSDKRLKEFIDFLIE